MLILLIPDLFLVILYSTLGGISFQISITKVNNLTQEQITYIEKYSEKSLPYIFIFVI